METSSPAASAAGEERRPRHRSAEPRARRLLRGHPGRQRQLGRASGEEATSGASGQDGDKQRVERQHSVLTVVFINIYEQELHESRSSDTSRETDYVHSSS